MDYKYRYLQDNLAQRPQYFPVVLVTGPRRSGKSTLANKLLQSWDGVSSFSFDTPEEISRFRSDPQLFFQEIKTPVVLDEIQNVPEIFRYIKSQTDNSPDKHCQFLLTGSQQFQMMRHVTESLAGRILIRELHPFSFGEITNAPVKQVKAAVAALLEGNPEYFRNSSHAGLLSAQQILQAILLGGYPPIYELESESLRRDWYRAYVQTYIQRDIRDLSAIHDLSVFNRFVGLVAGRSAHIINYSELGKDLGVSYKTAQHYLSLLETSCIWRSMPAYHKKSEKRLVKAPKGLILDTGLLCFLTGIFTTESLERNPQLGMIFESYVLSEIMKLTSSLNFDAQYFHFRTGSGSEVDCVIEANGQLIPIEIKFSSTRRADWGKGIEIFRKTFPKEMITMGFVLSLDPEVFAVTRHSYNIPFQALFPSVG